MVLADTSVWIDHLARGDAQLQALLEAGEVRVHPFVIAEIALGNLRRRKETLDALAALPGIAVAHHSEVLAFIENEALHGAGIGYVDVHLLASARLAVDGTRLWTRDKRLRQAALELGLAAFPGH